MFRRVLPLTGLLALAGFFLAVPGSADPSAGDRSEAEIAAMDLPAIASALEENQAALIYYLIELHHRYPDQVELPAEATDPALPALDAEAVAALRALSDDTLIQAKEQVSAEVDRLVARGESLQEEKAPIAPAPQSTQAATASEEPTHCYKMYGQAYSLCAGDDRGCKMIAANDYAICQKTGTWP